MLKALNKLFTETLKIDTEIWLYILIAIVAVAFFVALLAGLLGGEFKKVKSLMSAVSKNPGAAVASMKQMPIAIKNRYRQARMSGVKPSDLVTEQECVNVPYSRSLVSKIWIVTFVTTVVCAAIAYFIAPLAAQGELARAIANIPVAGEGADEATLAAIQAATESVEALRTTLANAVWILPLTVFLIGGLLTFIGALVGKGALGGAVGLYARFALAIDGGDAGRTVQPAAQQGYAQGAQSEPMQTSEPAQTYSAQTAEPVYAAAGQAEYVEPAAQPVFEQPAAAYAEPVAQTIVQEPVMQEPVVDMAAQQEEARRREREEKIAAARAAQAAQQAQAQAQAARPAAANTSADDVIARIEQIDRDGAPRETMREVAQLLQKERAKPENKTPEQQKKLNEALSKLLKAMSAASKK